MASIRERMQKARENWTTCDGFQFCLRRPTLYQFNEATDDIRLLRQCVVGWRDVKESDLVPGGSADPVPFDSDVLIDWLQDHPKRWSHIVTEVAELVKAYIDRGEAVEKNS
jgi:hypothetical protein